MYFPGNVPQTPGPHPRSDTDAIAGQVKGQVVKTAGMHEMSVAGSIIDIVTSELEKHGGGYVAEVRLEIGLLSGIEYGSLDFALKVLSAGSVMESAEISVEKPQGKARCNICDNEFILDDFIGCCSICNSFDINIISGKELRIKSIIIENS